MNELVSNLSSYAVAFTAIMGALALVIKPLRKWLAKLLGQRHDKIIAKLDVLETKVDRLSARMDETSGKVDILSEKVDETAERVRAVEAKADQNERDRLKDEIFRFGNIARQRRHISSEEFRNLGENYEKYKALGGNHLAEDEYNYTRDYYNRRGWEEEQ